MATYAIGDIHGCYAELRDLLTLIRFDDRRDKLWPVGDLVNMGPNSLDVLRLIFSLRDCTITTIGNHEVLLLAVEAGVANFRQGKDTFQDILSADDRDELLDWIRNLPLIHSCPTLGYTMVHAGLPPQWSIADAHKYAREAEEVLGDKDASCELFNHMRMPHALLWRNDLAGWERLCFILNACTQMRFTNAETGEIDIKEVVPPGEQSEGLVPWYEAPGRKSKDDKILFGHWAALYRVRPLSSINTAFHLDTRCVYGENLTAIRLEDRAVFMVPARKKYVQVRG